MTSRLDFLSRLAVHTCAPIGVARRTAQRPATTNPDTAGWHRFSYCAWSMIVSLYFYIDPIMR